MKNKIIALILIVILCVGFSFAQEYKKIAQTGFQFLSVRSDARANGMAGALSAVECGSAAIFYNPAALGFMQKTMDVTASYNMWIADIKHNAFSGAFNIANGRYGAIAFSVASVDYGEIEGTEFWGNDQGYIETGLIYPTAMQVGIGYAKSLSTKFSVGGQVRWAGQNLGASNVLVEDLQTGSTEIVTRANVANTLAFDFGTFFKTGWKSFVFGMSVRNFSGEVMYEEESFQLPLTFTMGVSMDVFDLVENMSDQHSLLVSIDASHPRSYPEYIDIGLEYKLMDAFFVRVGYMGNRDERGLTFGSGVQVAGLMIDYSYTPFGIFNNSQSFTLRYSF
ncbi:MAG: PorV/PorQ family protein [Candidatus Marinimicrobia bacterium]|nr:PorV/PorQ family protein [Candidatus Neomarinimicrobiota bacterium]